jgi:hypothetical protein
MRSAWARSFGDRGLRWGRQSGSTAHLVAPDPATSPLRGAVSVRLMLAAESEQVTDPGHVPRRTGPERPRTDPPGRTEPAARASGSTGVGPGPVSVGDPRAGSRVTVSSLVGLSAGRRRRRRDAEMLLITRRAERDSGLLVGGADVRSRA